MKIMTFYQRSHILLSMKWVRKLLVSSNLLLLVLTILAWFAPLYIFQDIIVIPILGIVYPAMLMVHGLFVVIWAVLRSKWLMLSLLMLGTGQLLQPQVLGLGLHSPYSSQETMLEVATFNTQFIMNTRGSDKIEAELRKHLDVDILSIQEGNSATVDYLRRHTQFSYALYDTNTTVAILSKHPILASGQVNKATNPANVILWADIQTEDDTIRVYNAHLESNRISGKIPEEIVVVANETVNLEAYFGILKHYAKFSNFRIIQAKEIKTHKRGCPHPVIICGDMNDSPMSRVYNILSNGMEDTWYAGGFGFGKTHDTWVPGLRIDHVFVSSDWNVVDYNITPVDFSDHHIVKMKLKLK